MIVFAKLLMLVICAFIQFHIYTINSLNIVIALIAMIISCIPTIVKHDIWEGKGLKIISGTLWLMYLSLIHI